MADLDSNTGGCVLRWMLILLFAVLVFWAVSEIEVVQTIEREVEVVIFLLP